MSKIDLTRLVIVIILVVIFSITSLGWLSYTIIVKLEQQLQEVQMKYEIIKNDPLAKDAMEAGG